MRLLQLLWEGSGGGLNLPQENRSGGGGGWNGSKSPDGPGPGGGGGGPRTIYGCHIGLARGGKFPLLLLLLLLSLGNVVLPFNLSNLFCISTF